MGPGKGLTEVSGLKEERTVHTVPAEPDEHTGQGLLGAELVVSGKRKVAPGV